MREVSTEVLGRPIPSTPEEASRIIRLRGQESFGSMSDDPEVVAQLMGRRATLVPQPEEAPRREADVDHDRVW